VILRITIQISCEWIIEFCWYDITLFVKLFLEFFYKKGIFNGRGARFIISWVLVMGRLASVVILMAIAPVSIGGISS
jgi:hypothetical protein